MNLVINASEAIGERSGGITATTALASEGPDLPFGNATDLPPGDYVRLEVSDTGSGITEEAKAKIFDPFFSAKFPGSGLGLAVVQGIVRAHGGAVQLVSAPGQGSAFQVFLPCAVNAAAEVPGAVTSAWLEQTRAHEGPSWWWWMKKYSGWPSGRRFEREAIR